MFLYSISGKILKKEKIEKNFLIQEKALHKTNFTNFFRNHFLKLLKL